jgi:hypothetical protein
MMGGGTAWNMQSVFIEINKLRDVAACWLHFGIIWRCTEWWISNTLV